MEQLKSHLKMAIQEPWILEMAPVMPTFDLLSEDGHLTLSCLKITIVIKAKSA
jgi:hypothetical protein